MHLNWACRCFMRGQWRIQNFSDKWDTKGTKLYLTIVLEKRKKMKSNHPIRMREGVDPWKEGGWSRTETWKSKTFSPLSIPKMFLLVCALPITKFWTDTHYKSIEFFRKYTILSDLPELY